jgi:hypothetical protein
VTKKKNLNFKVGDRVKIVTDPTWGRKNHARPSHSHLRADQIVHILLSYEDGDYLVSAKPGDFNGGGVVHQRHLEPAPSLFAGPPPRFSGLRLNLATLDEHLLTEIEKRFPPFSNHASGTAIDISGDPVEKFTGPLALVPAADQPLTWRQVEEGDKVTAKTTMRVLGALAPSSVTHTDTVRRARAGDIRTPRGIGHNDLFWNDLNLSLSRSYDSWTIVSIEKPNPRPLEQRRKPVKLQVGRRVPRDHVWAEVTRWTETRPGYVEKVQGEYWLTFTDDKPQKIKLQEGRDEVWREYKILDYEAAVELTHEPA